MNGIVPAYAAQLYFLMVFMALVDKSASMKAYAVILLVYLQILDSLGVSAVRVDCEYCSFAAITKSLKIYEVTNMVNFQLTSLVCTFPILYSPIGRLVCLAAFPIITVILLYVGRFIDYLLVTRCGNHKAGPRRVLWQAVNTNAKANIVFLVNVFYYPIAMTVVKVLHPCDRDPGDKNDYTMAYPWIECGSEQYRALVGLAGFLAVAYVALVPIAFFIVLMNKHTRTLDVPYEQLHPGKGSRPRSITARMCSVAQVPLLSIQARSPQIHGRSPHASSPWYSSHSGGVFYRTEGYSVFTVQCVSLRQYYFRCCGETVPQRNWLATRELC